MTHLDFSAPPRHAFYLRSESSSTFVWQHTPDSHNDKHQAIIICSPLGFEYTHSYRSLRYLAEKLATEGFTVFRFDFHGFGSSSGSLLDRNCFDAWQQNIRDLHSYITQTRALPLHTIIGIRLGAMLASITHLEGNYGLILWEPVIKGKAYTRQLDAISRLSEENAAKLNDDFLESGGFILPQYCIDQINEINLIQHAHSQSVKKVLLLGKSENSISTKFIDSLTQNKLEPTLLVTPEYDAMMEEPHKTKLPVEACKQIIDWLKQDNDEKTIPGKMESTTSHHESNDSLSKVSESPIRFGQNEQLFGILTKPKELADCDNQVLIFLNSGSVHQAGPNNLYRKLARELAEHLTAVLRIDLENLGDSQITSVDDANHPYQENAAQNVEDAITYLSELIPNCSITVAGVCSGAYNSFHAGLDIDQPNLKSVMLINPLTFYWDKSQSLQIPSSLGVFRDQAHYKQALKSAESWKKLLKGKISFKHLISFLWRRVKKQMESILSSVKESAFGESTQLAKDIQKIHQKGLMIQFVFADSDPGLNIVKAEMKRTLNKGLKEKWIGLNIIPNADHTFSTLNSRNHLSSTLIKCFPRQQSNKH